jgi:hypothetical protein
MWGRVVAEWRRITSWSRKSVEARRLYRYFRRLSGSLSSEKAHTSPTSLTTFNSSQ